MPRAVAVVWAVARFRPAADRRAGPRVRRRSFPSSERRSATSSARSLEWYQSLPLPPDICEALEEQVAAASGEAIADFLARPAGADAQRGASARRRSSSGLVVIPVWLFFVLKDREGFSRAVARAMPPTWRADAENMLALLGRVGGRWVRGQLLLGASIFVATAIGLTILTLIGFSEFGQFTLVLALIAGVLEWFPIIGPIVAAVPAILIGLSISSRSRPWPPRSLYIAIQQLENNILVPKVMGDAVELHPAVMIMALVVGGAPLRDRRRHPRGARRRGRAATCTATDSIASAAQPPATPSSSRMHGVRPAPPEDEPPEPRSPAGRGGPA